MNNLMFFIVACFFIYALLIYPSQYRLKAVDKMIELYKYELQSNKNFNKEKAKKHIADFITGDDKELEDEIKRKEKELSSK